MTHQPTNQPTSSEANRRSLCCTAQLGFTWAGLTVQLLPGSECFWFPGTLHTKLEEIIAQDIIFSLQSFTRRLRNGFDEYFKEAETKGEGNATPDSVSFERCFSASLAT